MDMPTMEPGKSISLADILLLLMNKKKSLAIIAASALVFSYLLVFFLVPPSYIASSLLIPLEQTNALSTSNILKGISNISLPFGSMSGSSQQLELFQTILSSRTTLTAMVDQFNLKKRYKQKWMFETLKMLSKNVKISISPENALKISVIDKSPKMAAEMTNYIVEYLNKKVIELNIAKARANKEFLEKRYQDVRANLEKSEDSLQAFQQNSNIMEIRTQVRSSIDSYAKMESDLVLKQLEKSIVGKYLTAESPQVKMLTVEIDEISKKMQELKTKKNPGDVLSPLSELPQQAKDFLRLERNIQIYASISQIILPLYEQAKYEEQKSIPVIQIIDPAIPPERKFFPPRTLVACCSAAAAFFISALLFVCWDMLLPRVTDPQWIMFLKTIGIVK